jgi:hypothetical protein
VGRYGNWATAYLKIRNSKTGSSSRDVPLHELILQLGFLEHRCYGRLPDEPLFPELIAQGVEPRRSGAFSGRFTEYRKKTKTYRPGLIFALTAETSKPRFATLRM